MVHKTGHDVCLEKDSFKNIRFRLNVLTGMFTLILVLTGWTFTEQRNREQSQTEILQKQAASQQDLLWMKDSIERIEHKLDKITEAGK